MKISEKDIKRKEAPIPAPVVTQDNKQVVEAIRSLESALSSKDFTLNLDGIKQDTPDYSGIAKYLGDKIEGMTEAIKNRPSAFVFDIQRTNLGNMDKVIVKPLRNDK